MAVGLGVMAGMRAMSAPAWVAHSIAPRRMKGARQVLTTLAVGELIADKLPRMRPRIETPSLIGRALSGAIAGASVARGSARSRASLGLLGAAAAIASSFAVFALRRRAVGQWRVPNVAAGLIEDAAVGALGAGLRA